MSGMIASWCRALAAAVVLTAAASAPALAVPLDDVVARGMVRIAVYRDFPPFSYREDGVLKGADVDLGKAIGEKLGLRVDFMELTADETMDDDLRNAVWKGPILGGGVADIMMHVPVNRSFAQRNDLVVIFGPYQRETYAVARDPGRISETAGFPVFQTEKIGVELDTVPDFYLSGAFGGRLAANVVHYTTVGQAVAGLRTGAVAAVFAPLSELEGALGPDRAKFPIGSMPAPNLSPAEWPIGLAVKHDARDLGYRVGDIVTELLESGKVTEIYRSHGLTHNRPAP
ncbi:substrate-binding periplasmic protein [Skermanella pratensis]|uniref:substrate-binding periplasmic protein n=1 Tax=Skermanella pratensis TaxID=2233999 RepID=UPI0013018CC8|nr:transporter substrate-binding domain-containing protein [Skermanella pratensis]